MRTIIAITRAGIHKTVALPKDTDCHKKAIADICDGESPSDPVQVFVLIYVAEGNVQCETYERIPEKMLRVLHNLTELVEYVLEGEAPADQSKDQNAPSTRRVQ